MASAANCTPERERPRKDTVDAPVNATLEALAHRSRAEVGAPRGHGRRAGMGLLTDVFDLFPYAVMVCDRRGRVVAANLRLREIVARGGEADGVAASCCSLLGCGGPGPLEGSCLTALALDGGKPLPEVRVEGRGPPDGAYWVTAAPLYEDGSHVVFALRPDGRASETRRQLHIFALGELRIETPEGPLSGAWLEQRPGQLLRLLVCERHRVAPADAIAEAIWPHAGPAAANTVRHFIHALRERLEPGRPKHGESCSVVCRRGGYALRSDYVWIDADEFEQEAGGGMAALAAGDRVLARARLRRAVALYRGDFLSDEPYAEWAFLERERLRAIACNALRTLAELHVDHSEVAADYLERLADMEPYDDDVQRLLISAWLRLGHRTRAARHYHSFRVRLLREFGERPEFELSDLASA
jgi:DNA-binding SARP family transcriptional activator